MRHECCFSESDLHYMAARLSIWTNNLLLLFQHLSIIFPQKKKKKLLHWQGITMETLPSSSTTHEQLACPGEAQLCWSDFHRHLPAKRFISHAATTKDGLWRGWHPIMLPCTHPSLLSLVLQHIFLFIWKPGTYDHRVWKTGLPVRSAVLKPECIHTVNS